MKKLLTKITAALALASVCCCSGVLDVAPDGRTTFEDIFGDNTKTAAYLNLCYDYIQMHGALYHFWTRGPAVWSDEAWDADELHVGDGASIAYYNGSASASHHPITNAYRGEYGRKFDGDFWTSYWTGIRHCTFFLQNIDRANVTNEADRRRWRAEARLLRAYYYSELLRWFGCGLPVLRDEILDWTSDYGAVERESYYQVVQFIIEDCDFALDCDDMPWRITVGGEDGRFTKAVAEAIKSRMILYAASPLYNEGEDHWQEAYRITRAARDNLRDNGYALYNSIRMPGDFQSVNTHLPDNFAALYNEYFVLGQELSASSADRETIYQKQSSIWFGDLWTVEGIGAQENYKCGTCPSQELVDAYETTDGQPVLVLSKPYNDEMHTSPNYNPDNTLYDENNPYENRDPRFYASIYYNGSRRYTYWGFPEPEESLDYPAQPGFRSRTISTFVGESRTGISGTARDRTRTGYYHRKFLHPMAAEQIKVPAAPSKLFRYGEILLNFAEAAAQTGEPAKMAEAVAAVNEVRRRVNMPALPSELAGRQQELLLRIRNERRVELAFEEHRYFDVRRWTSPGGDLTGTDKWITAMEITRNPNGTFSYARRPVRSTPRACYTTKYLKCPLPLRDVNIMKQLTGENWQNPGW